jgi:hypothetical protein
MARKKDGNPKEFGEFCPSGKVRTAIIDGKTFSYKSVQYTDVDGLAMFEGDIILGKVSDVDRDTEIRRQEMQGVISRGIIITGDQYRWPNCKVPYTIDASLPDQARVTDAIAHWEANTQFRFVLRTNANAASYPDWVTFRPGTGCSSYVGKQGGQQFINLASGCSKGNAIHEIGHTIGLWHEHSREDRNAFVTIHWDKIIAGYEHNFNQQIADGDDVGAYEYGSIMHYPRNAFSTDGSDTITPVDPAASIGQRTALSPGDIAAANSLCPKPLCPAAPKLCPAAPILNCPAAPILKCPPAPKLCPPAPLQCPAAPIVKCPPAPLQCTAAPILKCPPAPIINCPPAPILKCPPAPVLKCPPAPLIKCPPAPAVTCGAAPTFKPGPEWEKYTRGYFLDPSTGEQYSVGEPQPGMNQIPQIVINININGVQQPPVSLDYSQSDLYGYDNIDWTASEYPDPGESSDSSMTDDSSTASGSFDPECSE